MDHLDAEEKDPGFWEALKRALAEEGAPLDKDELRDLILDPDGEAVALLDLTEEGVEPLKGPGGSK
jgi:hypothetical protein